MVSISVKFSSTSCHTKNERDEMNMKALVIADGEGNRLIGEEPKPLIQLLGLSLIERVVLTAKGAGIAEFIIVIGFGRDRIKTHLGNGDRYGVKIKYIENRKWKDGDGFSVLKAKELLNENFVLLKPDHIVDDRILKKLVSYYTKNSVVLVVDRREPLPGDIKILEKGGKIVDIGEDIQDANCVSTGIFLCTPRIFSYVKEAKEGDQKFTDCIAEASKNSDAEIFDITKIQSYVSKMRKSINPWWIHIRTEDDLKKAKDIIIESSSKGASDLLAHYVHRPIENKLVGYVSHFRITPNQVTIIVNLLSYTVTGMFFFGYLLPASLLTFAVGVLDGIDGKLARVKLHATNLGSLEHSFDLLFEFSWFVALSLYLFTSAGDATSLILCIFIILFVSFYRHIYDQFRRAMNRSLDDSGDFERMFRRVAGRRNLYNIPILVSILLGCPLYSLVFVLFHSLVTAVVYSARATKHMYAADRGKRE
jgi:CDP-L-myo-inositol myo-inositolphosphotransferase